MADELTDVSQPSSFPVSQSAADIDMMLQLPRSDGSDESNTSAEMEPSVLQENETNTNNHEFETQPDVPGTMDTTLINVQPVVQVEATPTPAPQPPPPTIAAPLTSLPKARLPQDTTGLLEDRIKEDPRGDIDAWLALISEHRKRNKLDDARAVYDRFFKVFPQAVSDLLHLTMNKT